ncbi:MAG: 4-hydroxyphenylacetate decarboxylase small subunit [Bacillota bacterium]|uniref:4-hydroxyphenylacetate decarboxylase small subunit n=1 Tax=Thermanaerosceptrum fracticalcis TaxID=1712410 RepID=A0A7G6E265_THEFR|nr:4-hydroxyphenylacetate decarboxylase small subunit [Thermanaerosceptrum fracticalcis]QNB46169.1 4-hydroxyphenylacetate decarboxylase small subunit [Thermanaerosceptrum fracticalcis]
MTKGNLKHDDCRNFIPIDVAKGFCNVKKMNVLIDTPACEQFKALPKCKVCVNFTVPDEKSLGTCVGFKDNYWTYADLRAVTCEMYKAK